MCRAERRGGGLWASAQVRRQFRGRRAGSGAGRLLAGTMQEALITALSPQKERAAMPGDYFILQLDTPSVLVECGFISNPAEEALLLSPAYQEKLGEAIADGAAEYFRLAQAEK